MARHRRRSNNGDARLLARPGQPSSEIAPGLYSIGLDEERDGLLYVPAGYRPERPAPLMLSLHGAGGDEEAGLYPLHDLADEAGLILLSPASRGRTWDVLLGGFGPDVDYIDKALMATFDRCAVDLTRIGVSGFSDGASYALSIGISNGDLFPQIMAFSPGFAAPAALRGEPRFFVSHGTQDTVLSINRTSRQIVPELMESGSEVQYREFDAGHTIPEAIAREGLAWFLAGAVSPVAPPDQ